MAVCSLALPREKLSVGLLSSGAIFRLKLIRPIFESV
jgi:hypothetical protein